ncbi:hypothetical protein LCGC14_2670890, partial [marine sediment metagenome]
FGLVALAMLSAVMNLPDASVAVAPVSLGINVIILWRLWRHFRWARVWPMIAGCLAGVPVGVGFLTRAEQTVLNYVLAGLLIAAGVQAIVPHLNRRRWHPWLLGLPCGLLSGALAGAFNTGGPPAVAFVSAQNFDRFRYSATLQVALGVGVTCRIVLLAAKGMFTRPLLAVSLGGVVFAVVGAALGLLILKRIPNRTLRLATAVLLLLLGVWRLVG